MSIKVKDLSNEEKARIYLATGNTISDGETSVAYTFNWDKYPFPGPCGAFPTLSKEEQDEIVIGMAKELDEIDLAISEGRFTTKCKFTSECHRDEQYYLDNPE